MEQIKDQALQKYAKIINGAEDTKRAILKTIKFEEIYFEAKAEKKIAVEEKKEESFKFDAKDFDENVEPLSIREDRETFRKSIEIKEENFVPYERPKDRTNEEKEEEKTY